MATYQPYYNPTDWKNLPSTSTPLNRTNLYHAETGIKEADNRIVGLSQDKAEMALVNMLVKDLSIDTKTGVFTVTFQNGSKKTYDLDIEKVVTNFDINDDNELVLVLADGTVKTIDLTRFVYSVASTATISMQINNRVMTATIVDGSVTMEKLDAAIQTEFRQYMLDAQSARDSALQYQNFAKRYALGDVSFPGSETDNAKHYYEQSKSNAEQTVLDAKTASDKAELATTQAGIATQKATNASTSANSASADAQTATIKAASATASEQISRQKADEALASQIKATEKSILSEQSASLSKRYAVGGEVPEDTQDNSKWYYENVKSIRDEVEAYSKITVPRFYINFATGKLMSDKAATGINFYIRDGKLYGRLTK